VGGVSWYFLSGAIVNICKTFGVCVAICLLPLGGCSENKDSRTRDMRNFDRTLERANAGDAMAQYDLGVMYSNGTGVQEDQTEAVKWYRMAAEQGDADAQHNLGVMYDNGAGVPQDLAEAVKWHRKAAEQGKAFAQLRVGDMYSTGRGMPADGAEAVKWYRMAAEQGDADAQHNLGVMYDNGAGVPEDDVEAYAWFSVVATGGQIRGEKFRDSVKEQLTAEQLAEAQKRATELFEKYGSGK
jgi:TPR repeat protein